MSSLHPTEIARQIALVGKNIFDKIEPSEYTRQSWSKSDKATKAPHIIQMISLFNLICNWASSEVLRSENIKERAVILNRLIIIAEVYFVSLFLFFHFIFNILFIFIFFSYFSFFNFFYYFFF